MSAIFFIFYKENKIKMKLYSTKDKWYGITNPEDEDILKVIKKMKEIAEKTWFYENI